jgi:hypothetical protein
MTIGPHSGIIKITNKGSISNINTWDPWCHYNREHFNISLSLQDNDVILEIKDDEFDTKLCHDATINFYNFKKKIILHSIFHTGSLEVKNSFLYECKSSLSFLIWENTIIKKKIITSCKNALKRILY